MISVVLRSSQRSIRQIRFVFRVCLAIVEFDVHVARRNNTLFEREPYRVEVIGFAEGAKSVQSFPGGIVKIYPRARGLGVCPTRREARRRGEELLRKSVKVFDKIDITNPLFAVCRVEFLTSQNEDRIGDDYRSRRTSSSCSDKADQTG